MFDIHQTIRDQYGESDEGRVQDYIDGLMEEFAQSPEAQPLREADADLSWAAMMMEYANSYIGCTPPEMTLADFNEVVFELFPRKVSVEADQAEAIITGLRAFWSFVARQYGLDNARVILATLDGLAVGRLQKKLADPANFGMAKSFFMQGSAAGFDMTTQEGISAFQAAFNAGLQGGQLPPQQLDWPRMEPGLPRPVAEPRSSDEIKKKRKEKRRQREAKKRNRPR